VQLLPKTPQLTDEYEEGRELSGLDKAGRPCVSASLDLRSASTANMARPGVLKKVVRDPEPA